jgi:hypothetical protein
MRVVRDRKERKKPSRIKRLAVAAAAALTFAFSPMTEGIARAQDDTPADTPPSKEATPNGAEGVAKPTVSEPEDAADVLKPEFDPDVAMEVATEYQDRALSPSATDVDMSGNPRGISLNNPWDIGGNLYVNEAGSAVSASVRYSLKGKRTQRPLDLRLDAGNIWFGEMAAPFARFMLRPSVEFWRLKLAYYGSAAAMGNMASQLYTSHSAGLGYSQPIGKKVRLRMGGVIGGALSYPAWDDIYFNIAAGASLQAGNFLMYGMPEFYFAAGNPMQTAYIGHYKPRFQRVEFGAQLSVMDGQYTGRIFGDVGTINHRVGARVTRTINFSKTVDGDVWVAGGATHWAEVLGGRWDPMVMVGANIVFGGEKINSTNTLRYEHLQAGGVRHAVTSIPTRQNPGPYGFGRSGDPEVDQQVNTAKDRLMNSRDFAHFTSQYSNASRNEVIMAARFLGAFLEQVAYANDAMDSLYSTDFFNPEVKRISNADQEQIFGYMQRYVGFYNTNSGSSQLPEDLKKGIAICPGIHHVIAEFLRSNGIPATVASVNTPRGPHTVAIGTPEDGTYLFDYGNLYETPPGTFDQAMRFYGQNNGTPTFQSQLFGPDGYIGTYHTGEGRLLHDTIGLNNLRILGHEFLGVR